MLCDGEREGDIAVDRADVADVAVAVDAAAAAAEVIEDAASGAAGLDVEKGEKGGGKRRDSAGEGAAAKKFYGDWQQVGRIWVTCGSVNSARIGNNEYCLDASF